MRDLFLMLLAITMVAFTIYIGGLSPDGREQVRQFFYHMF